jgi:hypothetical protein
MVHCAGLAPVTITRNDGANTSGSAGVVAGVKVSFDDLKVEPAPRINRRATGRWPPAAGGSSRPSSIGSHAAEADPAL